MNESSIWDEEIERLWDLQDSWWIATYVFVILNAFNVMAAFLSPESWNDAWNPEFNAFLQFGMFGCYAMFCYYANNIEHLWHRSRLPQVSALINVPGMENFERN